MIELERVLYKRTIIEFTASLGASHEGDLVERQTYGHGSRRCPFRNRIALALGLRLRRESKNHS